jgi:hypothetical protein
MKTFHLTYWIKIPNSTLIKESKMFRNGSEAYCYIKTKQGLPVLVSEIMY